MPTLTQPIQDVLTRLATLQVQNADGATVSLYTRIFNNQYKLEREGRLYNYPKPTAFVEVLNKNKYAALAQGYRSAGLTFRIHLVHEFYNTEGTLEQDLLIFVLRDAVITLLQLYCPTGCGQLNAIHEEQDYNHDNTYHYIIDFMCNFTDTGGSTDGQYIYSVPPYDAEIEAG